MTSLQSQLRQVNDQAAKNHRQNLRGLSGLPIRFTSFLGDNGVEFYRRVTTYLGQTTGLPTELVASLPPTEQEARVRQEQIQVVFTCGLPYVKKADHHPPLLRLLAAPVPVAPRYQDRPLYFSDVVVRATSPYQTFASLRGTVFAYNEIHSFSGYMLPCYHLITLDQPKEFFRRATPTGSHARSMDWVERGWADVAAIDSVIFDMEIAQRPQRAAVFRVVARLGPCPMPPVAAVSGLADHFFQPLRQALLTMHTDPSGQAILREAGMRRFAPVTDRDYYPIRRIMRDLKQSGMIEFL